MDSREVIIICHNLLYAGATNEEREPGTVGSTFISILINLLTVHVSAEYSHIVSVIW